MRPKNALLSIVDFAVSLFGLIYTKFSSLYQQHSYFWATGLWTNWLQTIALNYIAIVYISLMTKLSIQRPYQNDSDNAL